MAAFTEIDWSRIDIQAIVEQNGLATIEKGRQISCRNWLKQYGYEIATFDCKSGLSTAIPELGRLFRWEQQFGYSLQSESRNLDALNDGFHFNILEGAGQVFEIDGSEIAWKEDSRWLCGLISIAQRHTRWHLALGQRFFTLLVVSENSPIIGAVIDQSEVPVPYWSPCHETHEFMQ